MAIVAEEGSAFWDNAFTTAKVYWQLEFVRIEFIDSLQQQLSHCEMSLATGG